MEKALIIYAPSRTGMTDNMVPLGPLAVANTFLDEGVDVKIYDLIVGSLEDLLGVVRDYKPDVVGYSGIASSYPAAKETSRAIREVRPEAVHMAGGALSSTYEILLKNNVTDYVVHGEAEVSLPKLLSFLRGEGQKVEDIGGISRLKDGEIIRSAPEPQLPDLDVLKLPAYHLIDMDLYFRYLRDLREAHASSINAIPKACESFDRLISTDRDKYLPMTTARGCTHASLFCYRHVKGVRRHSVGYVIDHIKHLRDNYGINGVGISDEILNNDLQWLHNFFDAFEAEFKDELFFRGNSMRADKVDKDLLRRLQESGGLDISFGHESGSAIILKEYRKGVTPHRNAEVTIMSKEAGLLASVQIVIGSPSETTRTVFETLSFLKETNAFYDSTGVNYLIPFPETPIWKYVQENNLAPDVEQYLERVARFGGMFGIGLNLTKSNDCVWKFWLALIYRRLLLNQTLHEKKYLLYAFNFFFGQVATVFIGKKVRALWGRLFGRDKG